MGYLNHGPLVVAQLDWVTETNNSAQLTLSAQKSTFQFNPHNVYLFQNGTF